MTQKHEIELELLAITEKYKHDFSVKLDRSKDALSSMIARLTLIKEFHSKLLDDLINAANKHFKKYDIDDTSETSEFIKVCYIDFWKFAKSVD
jgi:hypothetical protein